MKKLNINNIFFVVATICIFLIVSGVNAQTFYRNLRVGDTGEDVLFLQQTLNKDVDTQVSVVGPGSVGNETNYFGLMTESAVKRFQNKYKNEILVPNNLTEPTGFVGPSTIKKLNELNSASTTPQTEPIKNTTQNSNSQPQNSTFSSQLPNSQAYFSNVTKMTQQEIDALNQSYLRNPSLSTSVSAQGFAIVYLSPVVPKKGQEIKIYPTKIEEPFEIYVSGQKINSFNLDKTKGYITLNLPNSIQTGKNTIWIQKDSQKSNEFSFNVMSEGSDTPKITNMLLEKIYIDKENTIKGSGFNATSQIRTSFGNFIPSKQTATELIFVPKLPFPADKSFENEGIVIVSGDNGESEVKVVKFVYEKN